MCVVRKPHPFGNERHTIACGLSTIIYFAEIVEGRDRPRERRRPAFSEIDKTVGTMLLCTRHICNCSKVFIMDIGFCVTNGLLELRKKGVFGAARIKKHIYWPVNSKVYAIDAQFSSKKVSNVDALNQVEDGVAYHISCIKEPDYVMKLITKYGTLEPMDKGT